jgi:hypothetical protein
VCGLIFGFFIDAQNISNSTAEKIIDDSWIGEDTNRRGYNLTCATIQEFLA